MNHIHKLVWNLDLQQWIVCAEKSGSKNRSRKNKVLGTLGKISFILLSLSSMSFADQLCTAMNSNKVPVNPVNSNSGSGYLQNAQIVCTTSGDINAGFGGENGYSVGGVNPTISKDTSMVERWTNAGNELDGTIGITVNQGVELVASESTGLDRGILYVRAGYYRNYGNRGNGQSTAEYEFKGIDTYTIDNLLKVNLINNGSVTNLAKPNPDTHGNPAAMAVDFGDMPVAVRLENNGLLSSVGANTISVVSYQTVPRYSIFGETGYALLGLDQYKYSYNNTFLVENTGTIIQSGDANHTEGVEFNGAISIGVASAKEVHINNSGTIESDTYGINASLSSAISDTSIINSGSITSNNADAIYLNSKTFTAQGLGRPAATQYTNSVTLDSTLDNLLNTETGVIKGAKAGVDNRGLITTLSNAGEITGGLAGIENFNGATITILENTGEISSNQTGISNEGVIESLINLGAITTTSSTGHSIKTDDGIITNGIKNFGVLNGDIALGANTLNLLSASNAASAQPEVNGDIIGIDGSVIAIGDSINVTSFRNTDLHIADVSQIQINANSVLTLNNGSNWTANSTNNDAFKIVGTYQSDGNTALNGNVLSSGIMKILDRSNSSVSTLTINGNYTGDGGVLILNTDLGDDNSLTDKFVITGTAIGLTELQVINVNGSGAQTINGIHVIQTGSSETNETFYLKGGYVTAGAYDYSLNLREANTDKNDTEYANWYLESKLNTSEPEPDPNINPDIPVYTPDTGSYIANEMMGNTLFTSRLEDREGAERYQSSGQEHGFWMRIYGGHNKFNSMSSQLKTDGNSIVTQVGANILTFGENNEYNLGVMGGYAHYKSETKSQLTGRKSSNKIDGYSIGLYGTWYQNPVDQTGLFVDSWILWNHFKNKVTTADRNEYKYNSSGITASLEVGSNYLIDKFGNKDLWIQPQAQLIYQGVHADDFYDAQNVKIVHGSDNLQARVGVKAYLEIPTQNGNGTYRPYLALNYIHNTNPYAVKINNIKYSVQGAKNFGEVKVGIEGKVTENSQIWINASYAKGGHGNHTYQGNVGWKYNF